MTEEKEVNEFDEWFKNLGVKKKVILGLTIALTILNGCINKEEKEEQYNKENIIGTWVGIEDNHKIVSPLTTSAWSQNNCDVLTDIIEKSNFVKSNKLQFTEGNNLIYSYKGSKRNSHYNNNGGSYNTYSEYGEERIYQYQINKNILNLNKKEEPKSSLNCQIPSYYYISISKDTLSAYLITDSIWVDMRNCYYKNIGMSSYPRGEYTNSEKEEMTNEFMDKVKKEFGAISIFKFYKL